MICIICVYCESCVHDLDDIQILLCEYILSVLGIQGAEYHYVYGIMSPKEQSVYTE